MAILLLIHVPAMPAEGALASQRHVPKSNSGREELIVASPVNKKAVEATQKLLEMERCVEDFTGYAQGLPATSPPPPPHPLEITSEPLH
jgi:hypothetical protein